MPANTAAKHTALTNFANIREPDFPRTNFCDCKKKLEKKRTKFRDFSLILSRGHLSQINKTYISKQDCKLTTVLHRTLWTRQNITACCVYCLCKVYHTVQCFKRNLRCSVNVHSTKTGVDQKDDETAVQGDRDTILKGSSGWICIFPLTTDAMPAFSHPFAIWRFPSQLVRWLYKLTSQVACKGLLTESLRSTSISSLVHLSLNFDGIPAGKLTELQAEESSESEEEC